MKLRKCRRVREWVKNEVPDIDKRLLAFFVLFYHYKSYLKTNTTEYLYLDEEMSEEMKSRWTGLSYIGITGYGWSKELQSPEYIIFDVDNRLFEVQIETWTKGGMMKLEIKDKLTGKRWKRITNLIDYEGKTISEEDMSVQRLERTSP